MFITVLLDVIKHEHQDLLHLLSKAVLCLCSLLYHLVITVGPRFMNAPVHEQTFRAKNVSDD
jgi:hypothetical protein